MGDHESLSSFQRNLGIPINFQEESGLITFEVLNSMSLSMCQGISLVAAGTWGIFSSYSGDGHSKLYFVHRSQDSCLVMMDTSGI